MAMAALLGLFAVGCAPLEAVPVRDVAAVPLPFGTQVSGRLTPEVRDRYLIRVDEPGLVTLILSWRQQESMARIEWSAPAPVGVVVFDARNRVEMERRIPATPGFYYVEIVPWTDEGSYRLQANFTGQ
jgi:hypothetical protein